MYETIPPEELEAFREIMHVYSRGARIVEEGQEDDMGCLYLLREGEVEVIKKVGSRGERISHIEAVNFFGEMGLIVQKPRSATVVVFSRKAVVYTFQNPNLQILLSNPKWGNLLLSRLCEDLRRQNDELVALRESGDQTQAVLEEQANQMAALQEKYDELTRGVIEVLSVVAQLHKAIAADAVVTSREWHFLKAVEETVRRLVHFRLPQIVSRITPVGSLDWDRLRRDDILPDALMKFIHRLEDEPESVL